MGYPRNWPIAIRAVNIASPLTELKGLAKYARVRVHVSDAEHVLGAVEIWHGGAESVSVARLRDAISAQFAYPLFRNRVLSGLTGIPGQRPQGQPLTVSIIVPTCDRLEDLRRCLTSLVTQRTRHAVEIIVVDNRPASGAVRGLASEFPSVRIITEARPGLSYARNTGITQASGEIIVATDDDVTAPEHWIERLLVPFERPEVMAVTGNVLPFELETEAQCRFESYGGLGRGFSGFETDGAWFRSRPTAVPTWNLGATANAAFRAAAFRDPRIGLLDEALGAGMPTGCSEDTYLFYRILKSGYTIVYEPSAFVWHRHRQTMESLRAQIYAYSKGHVAYHLTTWLRDGDRRALTRLVYSLPKTYLRRAWHRIRGYSDYPLSLILLEILGNLAGPWALWRARRRVKLLGRSVAPGSPARSGHSEQTDAVPLESQVTEGPAA